MAWPSGSFRTGFSPDKSLSKGGEGGVEREEPDSGTFGLNSVRTSLGLWAFTASLVSMGWGLLMAPPRPFGG